MNRALLIAGALVAITVLATSAIVPAVEAKPFSDRKNSGIVANCHVDRVGIETINCTFSDKDGLKTVAWKESNGNTTTRNVDCDKRFKDTVTVGRGDLHITITDCADNTKQFCYNSDGKKLTQIPC